MSLFKKIFFSNTDSSNEEKSIEQIHSYKSFNIDHLKKQIKGKGNTKYPFLHKEYSPASRVPCMDFTSWIIDRINENDSYSIKELMRSILIANPGLGTGPEWIDSKIDSVMKLDFSKYIDIDEKGLSELKAIFIILSKNGGGRQFWILEDVKIIINSIGIYPIKLRFNNFNTLVKKANSFIKSMKKDNIPAWIDYNLYSSPINTGNINLSENNNTHKYLLSLPISSRLHYFDTIDYLNRKNVVSLLESTYYSTRNFGIDINDSVKLLTNSDQFILSSVNENILKSYTKDKLISICSELDIDIKKTWSKKKIFESILLNQNGKKIIGKFISENFIVFYNKKYRDELNELIQYKQSIRNIFELLCFI